MGKNLGASFALAAALIALAALTLYQIVQINHYEELVIAQRMATDEMRRAVDRLTERLDEGIAYRPGSGGGGATSGGDDTAGLDPVVAAQRRYYSDEEWAGLMAPGNMLEPRTFAMRVEGAEDGGHFHRAMITGFPSLHPIVDNAANITEVYRYVNRALAMRARNNPNVYIPELAYRIEVNEDHTAYHVWLRQGVMWQRPPLDLSDPRYAWLDVPHELTSDDFAFLFEVIQNPAVNAPHLRNYFEDFDRIEILGPYEFIIHWRRSFQGSIDASVTLEPLPRFIYAYSEDGVPYTAEEFPAAFNEHWFKEYAIGVGPYRMVRYEPDVALELARNEEYYDEKPPIEHMTFHILSDAGTRMNSLLAGNIEYTEFLPLQYSNLVLEQCSGDDPTQCPDRGPFVQNQVEWASYQGTLFRYLGWNADRPMFADRRVRRAMTHALNRERILDEIFHGLGRVVTGPAFIDGPYYDHSIQPLAFDLAQASELLRQAGWSDSNGDGVLDRVIDGVPTDFAFTMTAYGYRQEFMTAMEIYKQDLESIGVRMTIDGVQWPVMVERMQEKDFDAFTGGWVLGWDMDPYQIWHSSQADEPNGSNRVGFRNPEADAIIEEARGIFDLDRRVELFHRFHQIMHEEQPYTFFFAPRDLSAWRSNVENVNFAPNPRPFDLSLNWYLSSDAP
jgi:peptide/nickel transport system substrate-binding protein